MKNFKMIQEVNGTQKGEHQMSIFSISNLMVQQLLIINTKTHLTIILQIPLFKKTQFILELITLREKIARHERLG